MRAVSAHEATAIHLFYPVDWFRKNGEKICGEYNMKEARRATLTYFMALCVGHLRRLQ